MTAEERLLMDKEIREEFALIESKNGIESWLLLSAITNQKRLKYDKEYRERIESLDLKLACKNSE